MARTPHPDRQALALLETHQVLRIALGSWLENPEGRVPKERHRIHGVEGITGVAPFPCVKSFSNQASYHDVVWVDLER